MSVVTIARSTWNLLRQLVDDALRMQFAVDRDFFSKQAFISTIFVDATCNAWSEVVEDDGETGDARQEGDEGIKTAEVCMEGE